jgi:signal-transduction protein with cAMP-binding, CBS, and nucleotidyltransferase domain
MLDEVITCGVIEYIKECDLFQHSRSEFQLFLCKSFKVEMYQPYTHIILSGRSARNFFIIRQGVISVQDANSKRGNYYTIQDGDSFGIESFANMNSPRYIQ